MKKQKFSKKSAIMFGWKTVKSNLRFFAGLVIFVMLVTYLPEVVFKITQNINLPVITTVFFFVFSFIFWAINMIISMGIIYISVKFVKREKCVFSDLAAKADRFIDYLVSTVLYSIIVFAGAVILIAPAIFLMSVFQLPESLVLAVFYSVFIMAGLILLAVPGATFLVRFQFYQYYVVDKNMGPVESLKKSWQVTRGEVVNLILMWLLMVGINILGVAALGIGLLISIPITMIAMAYVYKKLDN